MSRACRAITAFFFFFSFSPSIFLFSINVVISSFIECMPVESPLSPLLFPKCVCVGGWVGGCVGVVDVQARVSVCK